MASLLLIRFVLMATLQFLFKEDKQKKRQADAAIMSYSALPKETPKPESEFPVSTTFWH